MLKYCFLTIVGVLFLVALVWYTTPDRDVNASIFKPLPTEYPVETGYRFPDSITCTCQGYSGFRPQHIGGYSQIALYYYRAKYNFAGLRYKFQTDPGRLVGTEGIFPVYINALYGKKEDVTLGQHFRWDESAQDWKIEEKVNRYTISTCQNYTRLGTHPADSVTLHKSSCHGKYVKELIASGDAVFYTNDKSAVPDILIPPGTVYP